MARHIRKVHVEGFRCLRDVEFELTDLHAFIGPNDSGKSTLLQALRIAAVVGRAKQLEGVRWAVEYGNGLNAFAYGPQRGVLKNGKQAEPADIATLAAKRIHVVRLDPDEMRKPTQLLPSKTHDVWFASDRGLGLAAVYDVLLNRQLKDFLAIQESVAALFPTVESIILDTPDETTKAIGARLRDGTTIPAHHLSEGLLYFLAFAAMQKLGGQSILLVEEPENGLHPARIADVIRVLRAIAVESQVVLATHSPLLLNELQPNEVSVVTRDLETGTQVTPLQDTPRFAERSEIFSLGELWIAYANGDDEAPLLQGTGPE